MSTIRLEEINAFLAVIEHGSLTRAADSLFITQPTLSQQLTNLELELGTPLIVRRKGIRQINLTPAGRAFVAQAEKWRKLWSETKACLDPANSQTIRLGVVNSLRYVFNDFCKVFSQHELPYSVFLALTRSIDIYTRVDSGDLEFGLVARAKFFNKTISIPLASEQLVFCCGLNSSYNQLVSTKNLDVRNEIFLSWGEDFSRWHTYWFGTSTPPRIELETTSLLEEYLFTNDRWAILPISVAESPPMLKILKICKLSDPPP